LEKNFEDCYLKNEVTNEQIPLASIGFDVNIFNTRYASVNMKQVYVNDSQDTHLETVFDFPIGLEFALHQLKVEFQDLDDPTKKSFAETEIKENELLQEHTVLGSVAKCYVRKRRM
jgi:hypothetical protein